MAMDDPVRVPDAGASRLSGKAFTSDLSVDELFLLEDLGMQPLGLVLGSSIYHVGLQSAKLFQSQEMQVLSQAMHTARSLAVERMEAEAQALDADGVVGVRLQVKRYAWGPGLLEFLFIGTAIRARDPGARLKPPNGRPFTSDLSGQDFWKLLRAGYRPLRLCVGNCVYHVAHQAFAQWARKVGQNAEMEAFTQATYDARELAMNRLSAEAEESGADGVVGVRLEETNWAWDSHIIEFFAVGTAVAAQPGATRPQAPALVLPMRQGGMQATSVTPSVTEGP